MRRGRSKRAAGEPRGKATDRREPGRSLFVSVWVTLGIGLALLSAAAVLLDQELDARERARYQAWTDNAAHAAQDGLERIASHLQGLATLFTIHPELSRDDFRDFTRPTLDLHLEHRAMRLLALEWLPKVSGGEPRDLAAWGKAQGVPDFRILERSSVDELTASTSRDVHFPILFQQPLVGRRSMIGFDYRSEPVRVDAMRRAAASGRMAASGRIALYRAEGNYGLAILAPVYDGTNWPVLGNRGEWDKVAGFAAAVVNGSAIADYIVNTVEAPSVLPGFRIYDVAGAAREELLYPAGADGTPMTGELARADVRLANRYLGIAAPLVLPAVHTETLMFIAVGLLIVLALAFRDWQRERLTADLRSTAAGLQQAERESQTAQSYYRALLETAPEAVVVLEPESQRVVEVNQQAVALIGMSRGDLAGVHPRAISARKQPGGDVDTLVGRYMASAMAGEHPVLEWIIERADGRKIPCEVRLSLLRDGDRGLVRASLIDITEKKITEQRQAWMLEQLRSLSQRMERDREQDRKEISAVIHDRIGQLITAVKLSLGRARKRLGSDESADGELAARLAEIDGLTTELLNASREIARELRPTLLDAGGFTEAVADEVAGWSERTGIVTETSLAEVGRVPDRIALALFRSLQEFLNNVARHAGASRVMVWLKRDDERLILSVHDDGSGFDVDALEDRRSFGLFLVRERAAELGGELGITSRPETGTLITLVVPLQANGDGL